MGKVEPLFNNLELKQLKSMKPVDWITWLDNSGGRANITSLIINANERGDKDMIHRIENLANHIITMSSKCNSSNFILTDSSWRHILDSDKKTVKIILTLPYPKTYLKSNGRWGFQFCDTIIPTDNDVICNAVLTCITILEKIGHNIIKSPQMITFITIVLKAANKMDKSCVSESMKTGISHLFSILTDDTFYTNNIQGIQKYIVSI